MAYETEVAPGAHPLFQHPADEPQVAATTDFVKITNVIAGLVSLGLIAGVAIWGYQLSVRDVTGVPVVRAAAGEMRVRPETPGGELPVHHGLAVNSVAAEAGDADAADKLILAPQPVILTDEDLPMDAEAVAIVQQAIADQRVLLEAPTDEEVEIVPADRVQAAVQSGSVEALVAVLTENVEPLDGADTEEAATLIRAVAGDAQAAQQDATARLAAAPGVKMSLRPVLRQLSGRSEAIEAALQMAVAETPAEIDPADLPAGTRLVQLGAFDTAEDARTAWQAAHARFSDLLREKSAVVQEAVTGGRTFYRLRAHGFEDLADARRLCSALVAEGADCIPVVTR